MVFGCHQNHSNQRLCLIYYGVGGGKDSGDQEEEDLEGFVLFSQPTYERVLSQRAPDGETTPPGPLCSALTVTTMDNIVGPSKVDSTEAPECAHEPDDAGTAGAAQAGLTPAVHSADRVQLNSGGPSGMFPIFRSRKDCKTLYIIRHGESEYNAACAAMGSRWEDPTIFDAPLTLRGKRQATALREHIAKWNLPSNVVWVTSPLSRAIETLLLALAVEKDQHKTQCDMAHRIHVLPDITERLVTSGDIGRSPKDLSRLFPVLEEQLLGLPEVWWYDHPTRRNCSNLRTFRSSEPKEELQKRIKAFRKWLLARSEKVFVAVGHSVFWKAFATACKNGTKQDALRNCGYMVLHV